LDTIKALMHTQKTDLAGLRQKFVMGLLDGLLDSGTTVLPGVY